MNGAKIKVIDNVYQEVTRYHTEPEWDNDDTFKHHLIKGFIVDPKSYYDFQCSIEEPKYDTPYWLVYANYDTGDSFGHYAGQVEFIDLFESAELANKLASLLYEDNKNPSDYYNSIKYEVDNGEIKEVYTYTWKGYFEYLNSIEVIQVWRQRDAFS